MKEQPRRRTISIRVTLLTTIFSLCLIPLLISSAVSTYQSAKDTTVSFKTNATTLSNIAVKFMDNKFDFYQNTLLAAIENETFDESTDPDYRRLTDKFKTITNSEASILNIYFCPANGGFVQALNEDIGDYDLRETSWYKDAIAKSGEFTYQEPYTDTLTGDTTFTIHRAVEKNGELLGVIALDVSLSSLSPQFETVKYGIDGNLIITDANGSIIINTNHTLLGSTEPTEYSTWEEISTTENGFTMFTHNDTKYTAIYATSSITGWKFIIKLPSKELISAQISLLIFSIIMIIAIAIICAVFIFALTKLLCKPIYAIKNYIERTANGHFDATLTLNTPITEFTSLADNLNTMQGNISDIMQEFNHSVKDMASHTETSIAESQEMDSALEQISSTVSEISHGTMESANSIELINTNVEQLSRNIEDITKNTANVNTMAHKTSTLGQTGKDISDTVQRTSTQTKISTAEVHQAITEVANNVADISLMSTAISSITEQTNLLALNASIEAARAGEAGKGFAVVAGEISKLADETAVSAQKINEIVKTIENFVQVAVSKVNETSSIVDSQVDAVEQSQAIFTDIIEAIDALSSRVSDITENLTTVNTMKNEVLEQVESLSAIAEESAVGAEGVADYCTNVRTSSSQFVNVLANLQSLSDDLEKHISKFKF